VNRVVVELAPMGDAPLDAGPPAIYLLLREPPGTEGGDPFQLTADAPVFAALNALAGNEDAVRRAGEELLQALSASRAQDAITAALQVQPPEVRPVYLWMGRHPGLHLLPWEALCRPTGEFLALDGRWPVGRMVAAQRLSAPTSKLEPPLRIAAVLSCLNVPADEEWDALRRALEPAGAAGKIRLRVYVSEDALFQQINGQAAPWLELVSLPGDHATFQADVAAFLPHILHFYCHGSASQGPHLEVAVASDWQSGTSENSHMLETAGIRGLTAATEELPWLVVLNACESAATGDSGAQSVAVGLVYDGVPAVVGMREPVVSSDAACFTRAFYSTLVATLDPVLEGTQQELTVDWSTLTVAARAALVRNRNGMPPTAAAARTKEWTLPAVHVRPAPFVLTAGDPTQPQPGRSDQLESAAIEALLAALPAGTPADTIDALRAELQQRLRRGR
jgi:hypothetical protein